MSEQKTKAADEKFCESCGEAVKIKAVVCPKCGVPQKRNLAEKNKVVAGLLGIFLGGFGAHKFYLGKVGMGFLYLVFTWTGIPWIIGFIEGIMYLSMKEEKFAEKYGN